jgi:hypothetical protein
MEKDFAAAATAVTQLKAVMPAVLPQPREQLKGLVHVLEGRGPAGSSSWVHIDLHEAFDPESSVIERTNWSRLVSVYVLFVPLLMTWVGLWLAVDAYNALPVSERRARSFFEVWVSGAESPLLGLTFSLSELARTVAAVFVIAILAGLNADRLSGRVDARRDALRSALTSASLALHRRYPSTPADATGALDDFAARLEGLSHRISALANGLDSSTHLILESMRERVDTASATVAQMAQNATSEHMGVVRQMDEALANTVLALQEAAKAAQSIAHSSELDRARRAEYDKVVSHLADSAARLRQTLEVPNDDALQTVGGA